MSDYRGRFLWYELMTSDVESAIDFYTGITGWSTQAWEGGGQPYTMWMAGEVPVGGVMALPADAVAAGAPPHWIAYVGAPDLDATVARALELGAHVVVPTMDLPEVGRMTILTDPQGAIFAAYQPATEPLPEEPPAEGRFSWTELASDRLAAWAFYTELFGWETMQEVDMGEVGTYQVYGRPGGWPLGGMMDRTPEMTQAAWTPYVQVADCDAAATAATERGGRVIYGPTSVPDGGTIAMCLDPQGAMFALHEAAAPG